MNRLPGKPADYRDYEHKYILNEHGEAEKCPDVLKWAEWFENSFEQRRLRSDTVCGMRVSTVFLALDHGSSVAGPPILWETMVFDKNNNMAFDICRRYTSRKEAEAGHEAVLEQIKQIN